MPLTYIISLRWIAKQNPYPFCLFHQFLYNCESGILFFLQHIKAKSLIWTLIIQFLSQELMWFIILFKSSYVSSSNELPFGSILRISSWFTSLAPFWYRLPASQYITQLTYSPFSTYSIPFEFENSLPLSLLSRIRDNTDYAEENTIPKFSLSLDFCFA